MTDPRRISKRLSYRLRHRPDEAGLELLGAILAEGLRPMKRHHVHLSPDVETATVVGARRGEAVILEVVAGAMAAAGHIFYLTGNGVWLTEAVEPRFLRRLT